MSRPTPTLYKIIAPAHRAVWRFGILILLAMVNDIARASPGHKTTALLESNFVLIYFLYFLYEGFNIFREYRHPRPHDLGLSTNGAGLGLGVALGCILLLALDWVNWTISNQPPQWQWMPLVWLAAITTYLMRPKRMGLTDRQSTN
jgi:hypothetical protein